MGKLRPNIVICFVALFLVSLAPVSSAQTLTIHMVVYDAGYKYLTEHVIPIFEAQHPGVKVELVRLTWGDREEKLITATAGGIPPDIFMNGAEHLPELVAKGLVHPIDEYIANWPDLDDFFPGALGSSEFQGVRYGLPIYTSPRVTWYRADMFEAAGLDPNKPPSNWDDLLQAARHLTRSTADGAVLQQGYDILSYLNSTNNTRNLQTFAMFLAQNGGHLFHPETGKAGFNNAQGHEALAFMKELKDAVLPPGYTMSVAGGSGNILYRGAAAMVLESSYIIGDFQNPRLDLSLAQHVRAIVPPPGKVQNVTMVYSDWFAIHSASPNKELAWEFLKLFFSPEILRDYDLAAGYQSPRRSTYPDFVERQPLVEYVYQTLAHSVAFPHFPPERVDLINAFGPQYRTVMNNQQAPQTALEEAARQWDAILK